MSADHVPLDFAQVRKRLTEAKPDRTRVATVPVWGWTGDGKTCSILTVVHYASPVKHAIGLALVRDTTELEQAVSKVPAYEGLKLPELARSTADRLPALSEQFIDGCAWPPGTEAATPYLLRLRGTLETYGFIYLPDLQGGAYRGADPQSRTVLGGADACVVLVDPTKYAGSDVEARRYQDAVDEQIQRCVEASIPAAIMISKADRAGPDTTEAVDDSRVRIAIIIENAPLVRVFSVSVLGDQIADPDAQLPAPDKRDPASLLEAWVWLLSEMLCRQPEATHRIPPVRLAASVARAEAEAKRVPELRQVGAFSMPPGRVLSHYPGSVRPAFVLLHDDVVNVATLGTSGDKPDVQTLGRATGLVVAKPVATVQGGELFIGERFAANAIWHGRCGDDLEKVSLPYELQAWWALGAGQLAGSDNAGRLHLLKRSGGRWLQVDFVADYLPKAANYAGAVVTRLKALVVGDGTSVGAVQFSAAGFGTRLVVPIRLKYAAEDTVLLSSMGTAAVASHETAKWTVSTADLDTEHEVDVDLEYECNAVAPDAVAAACVDMERRLHVVAQAGGQLVRASAATALSSPVNGMAWASNSPQLLVTSVDSWFVYRLWGFNE